jgi:glucokinase
MGEAAPQNTVILTMGTGVGVSIRVGGEIFRVPGGIHLRSAIFQQELFRM